jgi:hypothetical protein
VTSSAHATIALLRGDFAEAEDAVNRADQLAMGLDGLDLSGLNGVQLFSIRREQGRLAELTPVLQLLTRAGGSDLWRPGLAALYAELGMLAEAAIEVDRSVVDGIVEAPDDSRSVLSVSYLADAAAAVGDARAARVLYETMAPWSGLTVAAFVTACYGPVDRYLGMLAYTVDDLEGAERHLRRAVEQCRALRTPTYEAHCWYWSARVAAARADDAGAADCAATCRRLAEPLGMAGLLARLGGHRDRR